MAQKRSQITQPPTRSRLATSTTSSWRERAKLNGGACRAPGHPDQSVAKLKDPREQRSCQAFRSKACLVVCDPPSTYSEIIRSFPATSPPTDIPTSEFLVTLHMAD